MENPAFDIHESMNTLCASNAECRKKLHKTLAKQVIGEDAVSVHCNVCFCSYDDTIVYMRKY